MSVQNDNKDSNLDGLEPIVKQYQETKDERYFSHIVECYRSHIQGRAYITASRFGLIEQDCESTLMVSLFKAVDKYDVERGVPFSAYVKIQFKQDLNNMFFHEKRDNHFFGPSTCKQDVSVCDDGELDNRTSIRESFHKDYPNSVQMVYGMDFSESFEKVEYCQDIANLIADEDAAIQLLEAIKKVDVSASVVASLVALGYSRVEVAKLLKYTPEVPSPKPAQINWVNRRLEKCIKPTQKYYGMMGKPIPIKLKK